MAFFVLLALYRYKLNKKRKAEHLLMRQMNELETQVADVCKQGFAELQAGGSLAVDTKHLRPRSFEEFARRVLFTDAENHPAPPSKPLSGSGTTTF